MSALLLTAVLALGVSPPAPPANPAPAAVSTKNVVLDEKPAIAKGLATPVYRWEDPTCKPKAVVLLLHGFPQHGKLYDAMARELAARGMVVYAPDMRGLGRAWSEGQATRLDYENYGDSDLEKLARKIRADHPGLKLFVGGESMGGAFAIRLAALQPDLVDGLILSGAAIKLEHHYVGLVPQGVVNIIFPRRKVDFSNQIRRFFSSDPRIIGDLLRDPLVRTKFDVEELRQCKAMTASTVKMVDRISPDTPVLVLQAVDDRQTPVSSVRIFDAKLRSRDQTIVLFSPRGHVLLQTSHLQTDVQSIVQAWLEKHCK